jgi:cell division protein FtsI/penicillin-binding protein 2
MLRAYLAIFNKGQLIVPRLFKKTKKKITGQLKPDYCNEVVNIMRFPASRHPVLKKYNCASKTGTAYRIGKTTYSHNVNTFIVCGVPNKDGEFKYIILIGLLNPQPPQLAGVTVRSMMVELVEKLIPFVYNE